VNTSLRERTEQAKQWRSTPLYGVAVVFRRQMRSRNAWRDLAWTGALLGGLLALSDALQRTWAQSSVYSGNAPDFLLRWLAMGAAGAALLLLPCAAVLGAGAVPPQSEFEATQTALLTHLTAFDICAGRLLAGLWPVLSTLLASCAFWLAAQLGWRFVPGALHGFGPICVAHLTLLCAVFMVGAVGFLFATRRRPGRLWGRGATVALLWALFCMTTLFLANPLLLRLQDPTRLIAGTLLLNPASAVTTAFDMDVLRTNWLYDRTDAPQYPFVYPPPLASAGLFALLGGGALGLSAMRLRRAYR
jgi:hypothetical protein